MKPSCDPDHALFVACHDVGSAPAYDELYGRHRAKVYRINKTRGAVSRRMTGDRMLDETRISLRQLYSPRAVRGDGKALVSSVRVHGEEEDGTCWIIQRHRAEFEGPGLALSPRLCATPSRLSSWSELLMKVPVTETRRQGGMFASVDRNGIQVAACCEDDSSRSLRGTGA